MLRGNHGITDDICYHMFSLHANNTNQVLTPIAGGPVRIRITSLPTNHATTSVVRLDLFCIVVYCFVDLFWPLHNQVTWYQVCSDSTCNCTALYFWERGHCRAVVIAKIFTCGLYPVRCSTKIDNLNVSALCAFNSNTNADGWASHRASFRCFGNALADEPGHLPIGGLTSVSLHSQIYHRNDLHSRSTMDDGARQALSIGGILNDATKKKIAYSKMINHCAIWNAQWTRNIAMLHLGHMPLNLINNLNMVILLSIM